MATRTAEFLRVPRAEGIGLFFSRLRGLRTPAQPLPAIEHPMPFIAKDDRPKLPLITVEVQNAEPLVRYAIENYPGTYNVEPQPIKPEKGSVSSAEL